MSLLLLSQNISSPVLILLCWWLAHSSARDVPYGRLIASGYACVGLTLLITMLARNLGVEATTLQWIIEATKYGVTMTFGATLYRRRWLRRMARLGSPPARTD